MYVTWLLIYCSQLSFEFHFRFSTNGMARGTTKQCPKTKKLIWHKARLGRKVEGAGRCRRNAHSTAASFIRVISNTGGLLGILLGRSLLTQYELMEFFADTLLLI